MLWVQILTCVCGYHYGWTEAFPIKRETAQVVVKKLLEEIIPRFRVPTAIGSDNGPAFISQVVQGVTEALGGKLETLWCLSPPKFRIDRKDELDPKRAFK